MRARLYAQLMEAQESVARVLARRGISDEAVRAALDTADELLTADERREDLYVSALGHFVAALGGHVEVRAVFADDVVLARAEPAGDAG